MTSSITSCFDLNFPCTCMETKFNMPIHFLSMTLYQFASCNAPLFRLIVSSHFEMNQVNQANKENN